MIGAGVLLIGLLVALSPFISVWRVGGQMLNELPVLDGTDHRDERVGLSAMFDDDFILARRTFSNADERTVAGTLAAAGFEPMGTVGFSKRCCGDYDAVVADVQGTDDGRTVVELTASDSDWQLAWPLFSGFGAFVALIGVGILLTGRSAPREPATAPLVP